MQLREYQVESKQAVFDQWGAGVKSTLLILPTGCGKTIVFSSIIETLVNNWKRVLVLAHRSELLDQARDKLYKMTGIKCSLEKAGSTCLNEYYPVTVGSVQTLQNKKRLEKIPSDYFDVVIIDEAHHAITPAYKRILAHFENAYVLGVTATPDRGDKKALSEVFETVAYEYSMVQAIHSSYLCPITAQTIPLSIDLSKAKVSMGDITLQSAGSAIEPYLEQIADEMINRCRNRKTVVFLPLVALSKRFRDILNKKGFRACEVNGESEDRETILKDFESGKYNVICNAMLLTEGWDCPSVDCVIVLRPTKIRSLYCQMIGRGTRLSPNKKNLLVLDFLWLSQKLDLCRPINLVSDKKEVTERAVKDTEGGEEVDLLQLADDVEKELKADAEQQRAEKLAEEIEKVKTRKGRTFDPLQFALSIDDDVLAEYTPVSGWELEEPTEKQIRALANYGFDASQITTKGFACKLLDKLETRNRLGLSTAKQINILKKYGFMNVGEWTKEQATKVISRIASCGWRLPIGLDPKTYKPS